MAERSTSGRWVETYASASFGPTPEAVSSSSNRVSVARSVEP
jgi:hypothetical protein